MVSYSKRKQLLLTATFFCLLAVVSCWQNTTPAPPPALDHPVSGLTCPETSLPWDTTWIPADTQEVISRINSILKGSGLAEQGENILNLSSTYSINPAFALSMFRKEAIFAAPPGYNPNYPNGTRAYRNKNPGNIQATGECNGLPTGSTCKGVYGEINTDGRFGVYSSMSDGVRAYFLLLASEYKPGTRRDCNNIACIVPDYCPPSECDTNEYIRQVTDWTQQYQCEVIGVESPLVLAPQPTALSLNATVIAATVSPTELTPIDGIAGVWQGAVTATGEVGDSGVGSLTEERVFEIRAVCQTGSPCLRFPDHPDVDEIPFIKEKSSGDSYCFSDGFSLYCFVLQPDGTLTYSGGGPLWAANGILHTVGPSPIESTQVIVFYPTDVSGQEFVGSCWTTSNILSRPDAWRCRADNSIYDPCFSIAGDDRAVICGASPLGDSTGFKLDLTEPLPTGMPAPQVQYAWAFELADGTTCLFMGGATTAFNGERINYGCSDGWFILGEPQESQIWTAQKVRLSSDWSSIEESVQVFIKTVWL